MVWTRGQEACLGELCFFFFSMVRRQPRFTQCSSSAASDVYKRQAPGRWRHAARRAPPGARPSHRPGSGPASRPRACLLYTSPSPRDRTRARMPSSACKKQPLISTNYSVSTSLTPHDTTQSFVHSIPALNNLQSPFLLYTM